MIVNVYKDLQIVCRVQGITQKWQEDDSLKELEKIYTH